MMRLGRAGATGAAVLVAIAMAGCGASAQTPTRTITQTKTVIAVRTVTVDATTATAPASVGSSKVAARSHSCSQAPTAGCLPGDQGCPNGLSNGYAASRYAACEPPSYRPAYPAPTSCGRANFTATTDCTFAQELVDKALPNFNGSVSGNATVLIDGQRWICSYSSTSETLACDDGPGASISYQLPSAGNSSQ